MHSTHNINASAHKTHHTHLPTSHPHNITRHIYNTHCNIQHNRLQHIPHTTRNEVCHISHTTYTTHRKCITTHTTRSTCKWPAHSPYPSLGATGFYLSLALSLCQGHLLRCQSSPPPLLPDTSQLLSPFLRREDTTPTPPSSSFFCFFLLDAFLFLRPNDPAPHLLPLLYRRQSSN